MVKAEGSVQLSGAFFHEVGDALAYHHRGHIDVRVVISSS
jgi:hypothetical protein